jgi:hypothetical protein
MANGLIEADVLAIVRAVADGKRERDVARLHGLTIAVRSIINQAAGDRLSGESMRREVLLEVARLDALLTKYHGKAMGDAADAIQSAAIYHKLAERKHTLCGLNPVTGYAVQIMHTEPPQRQMTTTDELEAALARIQREHDKRQQLDCAKDDPSLEPSKPH